MLERRWLMVLVLCLLSCSRRAPSSANHSEASTAPGSAKVPAAGSVAADSPASTGALVASAPVPSAAAAAPLPDQPERTPDIEYVPTPQNVVDKMLEVANITPKDVLYDLGCGDGRIVVTAAKRYGIKAVGFDIDPQRVRESRENVANNGVSQLVTIELKDVFKVDLTPATVVTLYLLPELNVRLIPQLEQLRAGARIVSHDFHMEGVKPERRWSLLAPDHVPPHRDREHMVYLWKTPLKKSAPK